MLIVIEYPFLRWSRLRRIRSFQAVDMMGIRVVLTQQSPLVANCHSGRAERPVVPLAAALLAHV